MHDAMAHWDQIYCEKQPHEVSWTQPLPQTSLGFIRDGGLAKTANIIDVGGGESKLVDFLLEDGFQKISVLDISSQALQKARERLGDKARQVSWIVSDILEFKPKEKFDGWHDRAMFHFLTAEEKIKKYVGLATKHIKSGGFLIMGAFSLNGPDKCSGLNIKQYSPDLLRKLFAEGFELIESGIEDHITPFDTKQNFVFCRFKRK